LLSSFFRIFGLTSALSHFNKPDGLSWLSAASFCVFQSFLIFARKPDPAGRRLWRR
jgi:hypothetical protein